MKKINSIKINPTEIREKIARTWLRYFSFVLTVYFLTLLGVGSYIWYKSSYKSAWTQLQKDQYIKSKDTSVTFRENDFKKVLQDIEARKQQYNENPPEIKDIFK